MSSIRKNKRYAQNDIINALTALPLPCIQLHNNDHDLVTKKNYGFLPTFSSTNLQEVHHILVLQQLKDLNLSKGGDRELNNGAKNTKSSVTTKQPRNTTKSNKSCIKEH